jgi:hypothetical protein
MYLTKPKMDSSVYFAMRSDVDKHLQMKSCFAAAFKTPAKNLSASAGEGEGRMKVVEPKIQGREVTTAFIKQRRTDSLACCLTLVLAMNLIVLIIPGEHINVSGIMNKQ